MRTFSIVVIIAVVVLVLGIILILRASSLHIHIFHYITHHLLEPHMSSEMTELPFNISGI